MFARLLRISHTYMGLIDRHPWRTQCLTTAGLMGGGDIVCQVLIEKKRTLKDYDKIRTIRFLGVGLLFFGPGMHVWYSYLDRRIKGSILKQVGLKLLLDQSFFLPSYIAVFVALMGGMRGDSAKDIKEQLRIDFKDTLITSWGVWVPVQTASFALLPGQFRVIAINIINLFWNTYMSWKTEKRAVVATESFSLSRQEKNIE